MNRVCLITGSGSGNGSMMARRIAEAGYDIALHHSGRDAEGAEENAVYIREHYSVRCEVFGVDFMKEGAVSELFRQFKEKFERLDLCIANSGRTVGGLIKDMTPEVFDKVYRINWTGTFFTVKEAAAFMIDKHIRGSIIVIASNHHHCTWAGSSAYGSFKQAAVRFVNYAGLEFAPYKIRVNCLAPGYINNEGEQHSSEGFRASMRRNCATIPLERYVTSRELADMAMFLASDCCASVTGETIEADGGIRLTDGSVDAL